MTNPVLPDPFANDSHPSVSFKDVQPGYTVSGRVLELPIMLQSTNFEDRTPKVWEDGRPVMSAVTVMDIGGETMSLWAQKPSALFAAIQAAQETGGRIAVGGTLTVQYTGDIANVKNPRLNPIKQYRAHYAAPDAFATAPATDHVVTFVAPGPQQEAPGPLARWLGGPGAQQAAPPQYPGGNVGAKQPTLTGFTVPPTNTFPPLGNNTLPQAATGGQPWVTPTAANAGTLGQAAVPATLAATAAEAAARYAQIIQNPASALQSPPPAEVAGPDPSRPVDFSEVVARIRSLASQGVPSGVIANMTETDAATVAAILAAPAA